MPFFHTINVGSNSGVIRDSQDPQFQSAIQLPFPQQLLDSHIYMIIISYHGTMSSPNRSYSMNKVVWIYALASCLGKVTQKISRQCSMKCTSGPSVMKMARSQKSFFFSAGRSMHFTPAFLAAIVFSLMPSTGRTLLLRETLPWPGSAAPSGPSQREQSHEDGTYNLKD